jgi:hypothetical protein
VSKRLAVDSNPTKKDPNAGKQKAKNTTTMSVTDLGSDVGPKETS